MWNVLFHRAFATEFLAFPEDVQAELDATIELLRLAGPSLGRPHADTLKGSKYSNMKELRFSAAGGVWRAAYAFDPERAAIILVAADKAGVSQQKFYTRLIARADARLKEHLAELRKLKE